MHIEQMVLYRFSKGGRIMEESLLPDKKGFTRPGFLYKPISRQNFFKIFLALNVVYMIIAYIYEHILGMTFSESGIKLLSLRAQEFEFFFILLYFTILLILLMIYLYILILRCNDRNKPIGYACIFAFVPIIGQLWGVIECLVMPSVIENNKYADKYHEYIDKKLMANTL
jgi:uncharacterized membrane protein YhaH (DUF805 family)